jgi:hypothetical protein
MNFSSPFLLLSIGLVMLIVQQHMANAAPMDKAAGNELKSTLGMAALLLKSFQKNDNKNVTFYLVIFFFGHTVFSLNIAQSLNLAQSLKDTHPGK